MAAVPLSRGGRSVTIVTGLPPCFPPSPPPPLCPGPVRSLPASPPEPCGACLPLPGGREGSAARPCTSAAGSAGAERSPAEPRARLGRRRPPSSPVSLLSAGERRAAGGGRSGGRGRPGSGSGAAEGGKGQPWRRGQGPAGRGQWARRPAGVPRAAAAGGSRGRGTRHSPAGVHPELGVCSCPLRNRLWVPPWLVSLRVPSRSFCGCPPGWCRFLFPRKSSVGAPRVNVPSCPLTQPLWVRTGLLSLHVPS